MALAAFCLVVAATGCGGDDPSARTDSTRASWETEIANAPGPNVQIPNGAPPRKLVVDDLKIGTGKPAKSGDEITVQYVGIHWEGTSYANSWTYPEPPSFILGTGRLPRGFEQGILGMKSGGKRQVIVPPELIFPPGRKAEIHEPEATVVFLVDMLKVREPRSTASE